MDSSTLLWRVVMAGGAGSLLAATGGGLWLWWRSNLKPFTSHALVALFAIDILLVALFIHTWSGSLSLFLDWLFDLNQEYTLGTLFSTVQLIAIGLASLTIGLFTGVSSRWQRVYWLFLGIGFMFLGIDEYFQIHEWLIGDDRWRLVYGGFGGVLVIGSAIAYWQALRQERRFFVLFFIGLFIMGLSGIIMEYAVWQSFCYTTPDSAVPVCENFDRYLILEEGFELVGETITLSAFLIYAQENLTGRAWCWQQVAVTGGIGFGTLALVFYLWGLPAIEARLWATPVQAHYQDGDLQLIGYRIASGPTQPGATVPITLYWRAKKPISSQFSLSLHALTQPDLSTSIASVEEPDMGQYPSRAFLPGITVRKSLLLALPDDLPTPTSYRLMLRVWSGNWQRGELDGLEINATDLPLLTPDSLLFGSVPVVAEDNMQPPTGDTNYLFADRFAITHYAIPETATSGGTLPLTFEWHTDTTVRQNLTQFIHLLDSTTGEFIVGFDQPPFGGRFPTSDWPAAVRLWDEWEITLPDNLPAGSYEVYTGLYDSLTIERLPVVDRQEQPISNNAIYLGILEIRDLP